MTITRWTEPLAAVGRALLVGLALQACSGKSGPASFEPAPPGPADRAPPLPALEGSVISDRLGAAVTPLAGGAVSATIARVDLPLRIEGAPAAAALGLSTDVVFRPAPAGAAIAGSTVLLQDEVSPVLDTLLAHGIRVVGLYNRLLFEEPRLLVLRFEAEGQAALLASGVQSIAAAVRDARTRSAQPMQALPGDAPGQGPLDAAVIGGALGVQARVQGETVVVELSRASSPLPGGGAAGAAGTAPRSWLTAAFSGSDLRAALDGRCVLESAELSAVLSALRAGNVHLVGLVPLGGEGTPRSFTLFFRGKGTSLALVRALDQASHVVPAAPAAGP